MSEKSPSIVLKKVYDDISKTQEYLNSSSKLAELLESINFKDENESDKIIEDTKNLVDKFKDKITSLSRYFTKHYSNWRSSLTENSESSNNLCEDVENGNVDSRLLIIDDSFCTESESVQESVGKQNEDDITKELSKETDRETTKPEKQNKDLSDCDNTASNELSKKATKTKNQNKDDVSDCLDNNAVTNELSNETTNIDDVSHCGNDTVTNELSKDITNTGDVSHCDNDTVTNELSKDITNRDDVSHCDNDSVLKELSKEITNIEEGSNSSNQLNSTEIQNEENQTQILDNCQNNVDVGIPNNSKSKKRNAGKVSHSASDNTDVAHVSVSEIGNSISLEVNQSIDSDDSNNADPLGMNDSSDNENSKDSNTKSKTDINEDPQKSDLPVKVEPIFKIKCVDITKLLDPNAVVSNNTNKVVIPANSSIVVISDSDNENSTRKKSKKDKSLNNNKHKSNRRSQKKVIVLDDSDSGGENYIRDKLGKNSQISIRKIKNTDNGNTNQVLETRKSGRVRKRVIQDLSVVSSLSENSASSDGDNEQSTSAKHRNKKKNRIKDTKAWDASLIQAQKDKKFSWKSYVPLKRISAQTLLKNYKKWAEKKEVQRLTNMESLKRSRRRDSNSSASDSGKTKRKCTDDDLDSTTTKKSSKKPSTSKENKESHNSETDGSDSPMDVDTEPAVTFDDLSKENDNNKKSSKKDEAEIAELLLGDINSDCDKSRKSDSESKDTDEDKEKEKNTTKKKNKEKKKNDKEKDESDSEDGKDAQIDKKKKKWRKDKLLTENITESDSDEDFAKYVKRKEKMNEKSDSEDVVRKKSKKRFTKRRAKNVLGSDSDESASSSKNKSDSSSSNSRSSDSEKKSDDDKDSDDDESDTQKKKSRRRIKRLKDSSDEGDGDADKSTRKNIRKVWNKNDLSESTIAAEKEEEERKRRIAEKQKKYNLIFDSDSLQKASVDKVVLDFDDETNKEVLKVSKKIVKHLKPHQAKGIQFMWNACFESLQRAKKTKGSGCILAHCMGLGKTLQVIGLTHTLLASTEETGVKKVLVVCPLGTVLNWADEFKKWLPNDDVVEVFELVSCKQNVDRMYQVQEWNRIGGALIMGYDMFRNLTNPQNKRLSKRMRNTFLTCLVDPGPDLVVCDEGHLLKNEKTSLSIAMNRLNSLRRIVLTGTPLQNNLKEYFCMVQFVKPSLLGTYKEYLNRFVNPITNGQYTDSTEHDINIMRKRSHVLHKMLDGIVQRRDYGVLAPFLPPKHEYVLFVSLTELQIKLYKHYMQHKSGPKEGTSKGKGYLFQDFNEFQRICTHPRVLMNKSNELKKTRCRMDILDDESEGSIKDFIDDDEEEKSSTHSNSSSSSDSDSEGSHKEKKTKGPQQTQRLTRATAATYEISDTEVTEVDQRDPSEWWKDYCEDDDLDDITKGGKISLLFEILKQCEIIGDKVLIFSQSLYSLDVIEYFLGKIDDATQNGERNEFCGYSGSWSLGLDYFRLDGSSSCDNRAAWCKTFNDPDNIRARLFLISTRAGGLGINLVAANRVIIFDVSWNPSHDTQSIYRVYRFGQTKPSFIYRFVTLGTMEMKVYERQVTKQAISKRVIDEQQIDRHYNQSDLAELYNFEPIPEEERPIPLVPKDILLGELLQIDRKIYKYHEHQSLLENKEDEVLDEAERKAAWEEFENEKKARMYTGSINNVPVQSLIIALRSIVRKENPTFDGTALTTEAGKLFETLQAEIEETGASAIFQKAIKEIKLLQAAQQQSMDEYYKIVRQQQILMQQYRQQQQQPAYGHQMNPLSNFNTFVNPYYSNPPAGNRRPAVNSLNYPRGATPNPAAFAAQSSRANQNPVDYIDLND